MVRWGGMADDTLLGVSLHSRRVTLSISFFSEPSCRFYVPVSLNHRLSVHTSCLLCNIVSSCVAWATHDPVVLA